MIIDTHVHLQGRPSARQVVKELDNAAVDVVCLLSDGGELRKPDISGKTTAKLWQDIAHVAKLAKHAKQRILPFAYVDPRFTDRSQMVGRAKELGVFGLKMIARGWSPDGDECLEVCEEAERLDMPVLFHSGILMGGANSKYNRPANFGELVRFTKLKFILAHISWPWCDECIATLGVLPRYNKKDGDMNPQARIDISSGAPTRHKEEAIRRVLDCLGDEIMFYASDAAIPGGRSDYNMKDRKGETIDLLRNRMRLSRMTEDRIMGFNAAKYFGILGWWIS